VFVLFRKLNSQPLTSRMWQRRTEWQKKKKSLDAIDAANSLTIASAYAPTAARLQIAIAALVTAEQQAADKNLILRLQLFRL